MGKTLREARNRRKIDLPQVEAATKIRIRYLRAIENEEWDVLPGEAYVRAFIRTYASFLGLDGERLAEEHRREVGATRPAERLPRVEPATLKPKRGVRRGAPRIPPRLTAAIVSAVLVAVLVVVAVLSSGGGGSGNGGGHDHGKRSIANGTAAAKKQPGLSLRLTATAEVWVCLLDGRGDPVVNGQILEAGAEAGPYRSGSFTVALGNGAVRMMVNGQQAEIPESSSPVGYSIAPGGALREIPEGERPSCT